MRTIQTEYKGKSPGHKKGSIPAAAGFARLFEFLDLNSKKGHEFRPMELSVTLTKVEGTLRVDTILVDAGDFRNLKWIRIHRN